MKSLSFKSSRGFNLVELMVGLVIAMLGVLMIFKVFTLAEQNKRTTTGANDATLSSTYAAYYLSSLIQSAGNTIGNVRHACGCTLAMQNGATATNLFPAGGPAPGTVFPSTAAGIKTLFNPILNFTMTFSPAYIVPGSSASAPDSLIILSGNSQGLVTGVPGILSQSSGSGPWDTLAMNASVATGSVANATGVNPGDLVVGISQQDSNALSAGRTCAISEVHALPSDPTGSPAPAIPLGEQLTLGHVTGSTYYAGNFNSLIGTSPVFTDLGPVGLGEAQSVNFKAYAVGTDPVLSVPNSLISYDMITGASTSIADNVVNIKMVYILNPANQTGSGDVAVAGTLWRPSAATGNYAPTTLSQHPLYIQQLMGIRLAVVTINGQPDKAQVSPATLKIFPNLVDDQNNSLEVDMPLTAAQRYYRYKITDITVPFRNMQLLNGFCA